MLFGLDELVCQLVRPNLQQARGIAMVGAGIIKCRDTIEESPHLGFARGLADDRVNRFLQGSCYSRHTGRSFSSKCLAIEFSFAGNDDVGALDLRA